MKQLILSYGQNRRIENPWRMTWTSFGGEVGTLLKKTDGWENWEVRF